MGYLINVYRHIYIEYSDLYNIDRTVCRSPLTAPMGLPSGVLRGGCPKWDRNSSYVPSMR